MMAESWRCGQAGSLGSPGHGSGGLVVAMAGEGGPAGRLGEDMAADWGYTPAAGQVELRLTGEQIDLLRRLRHAVPAARLIGPPQQPG